MANPIKSLPHPNFSTCKEEKKRKADEITIIPSFFMESPLSKETLSGRIKQRKTSCAKRALFKPTQKFGTDVDALSKIYEMEFNPPPLEINKHSIFALETLMIQIECCLRDHFFYEDLNQVRKILKSTLLNDEFSPEQKMAELGCILYLLDRERTLDFLDHSTSFLSYRADEICVEIEELIHNHIEMEEIDKNRLIPSGKIHYLLRTFAKMIVTADQKLNLGALYALILILEDPTMEVISHLKPEHHAHMLRVINQLITNPAFKELVEKEVHLHPDLASLICIDLKIAERSDIPSVAVMWDCIMALLFDIRQQSNHSNCFAIGALIYAIENSPYKVLVYMLEALKKGHFAFNERITIPILPLVENRLAYEKELIDIKMPSSQALELTTFQNISTALNLSSSSLNSEESSINDTLRGLMEKNNAEKKLPYAQKLLHTYKHNALIQMVLALIEFEQANGALIPSPTSPFSKTKTNLLKTLFSLIPEKAQKEYADKIKQQLKEQLWLKNVVELHVSTEVEGEINYGPSYNQKTITNFEGDSDSLIKLLGQGCHVYFLENGNYEAIETLSGLQQRLTKIAYSIHSESGYAYPASTRDAAASFESESAKSSIAKLCANQIKGEEIEGITRENLIKSDLLLFSDSGGAGQYCLSNTFGLKYATLNFSVNTPSELLERYYTFIKGFGENCEKTFLLHSYDHAFTQSLKESLIAFKNSNSFGSWIKGKINSRASTILKKPLSSKEAERLINFFTKSSPDIGGALSSLDFENYPLTHKTFYDLIINTLPTPELRVDFSRFFDIAIMRVEFSTDLLKYLLKKMDMDIDKERFDNLVTSINIRFNHRLPPFLMAREIRKALLDNKLKSPYPSLIEQQICDFFSLPISVDLGDLNYYDYHREDPLHTRLIVRYDFGNQNLQFFLRKKEIEVVEKFKDYKKLKIFYPPV